jgi:hypothetical protein
MGKITVNYGNGGIGGILPSQDQVTGLIYDSATLPSGFSATSRIKEINSLKEAKDLGINNLASDETKAGTGGTVAITAIGNLGDMITIYAKPANHEKILLGITTSKVSDTVTTMATRLTESINLQKKNGWTATSSTGVIQLIPPAGLGQAVNGAGVITVSSTGTIATTVTNFSGGVGSKLLNLYYLVDTYFKANQNGKLFIGIYDFTSAFDETKISAVQNFAKYEIRQIGIYTNKDLSSAIVNSVNAECELLASRKKPLCAVIAAQPASFTKSTLPDISGQKAKFVSVTIGNSYGETSRGYNLKGITNQYPSDLGALLGHLSREKVGNSIAWVGQHNIQQGTEFEDVMLITGDTWSDIEDLNTPTELYNKGYIFPGKQITESGSFFYNSRTADITTSDFLDIERTRTMNKVARLTNTALTPFLSSPILVAANGEIDNAVIESFNLAISQQLTQMVTNAELSAFSIFIDPTQQILVTKNLIIDVVMIPIGKAENITINLNFALSL